MCIRDRVCININPGSLIFDGSHVSFSKSSIDVNLGTIEIRPNSTVNFDDTKIRFKEGSIVCGGTTSGTISAIWGELGSVSNYGQWGATISKACMPYEWDINGIDQSFLPTSITADCDQMNVIFSVSSCPIVSIDTTGGGTVDPLKELMHGDAPMIKIGSVYANWAADLNNDRQAIYQGPRNDITTLLIQVITDGDNVNHLPNYIRKAYDNADLDMDGDVIYQGPDNDRSKLLFDVILRHPSNTSLLPNFIVTEQLPR